MRPFTFAIVGLCLVAGIVVAQVGAQLSQSPIPGTDSPDCQEARVWHLQAAMRHSEATDQEYHLGAADAAYMLAEYGAGACEGWDYDAQPTGINAQGETVVQRAE